MSLAKVRSHRGIERDRSERSYYPSALTVLEEKQIEQMVTLENLEKETSELELRLNDTLFELASESTLQFAFQYKGDSAFFIRSFLFSLPGSFCRCL